MNIRKIVITLMIIVVLVSSAAFTEETGKDVIKDYVPAKYIDENFQDMKELDGDLRSSLENIFPEAKSIKGAVVYPSITDKLYMIIIDNLKMGYYVISDGKAEKYDESRHSGLLVQNAISETLEKKMGNLGETDAIDVFVIFNDLDHDKISKEYSNENSKLAVIEEKANNNGDVTLSQIHELTESKRKFYKQQYKSYNNKNLDSLGVKSDAIKFTSNYSPLTILSLTKKEIYKLSENDNVYRLELFKLEKMQSCAEIATEVIQADYTRDVKYLDGTGVIIGQIEPSVPLKTNSELDGATIITRYNITNNDDNQKHASRVAALMVGETIGLVPDATLYATACANSNEFFEEIEWLIDQGVDVINMSASLGADNTYYIYAQWIDHLAVTHSVHFVSAAGNYVGSDTPWIATQALGYNIVAVGGFDDNDSTNYLDHSYYSSSSYDENNGAPEKPDIIAPSVSIEFPTTLPLWSDKYNSWEIDDGTSYGAPFVTATIAQMIDYEPTLATQQTSMKAILAASAYKKVNPSHYGIGITGTQFYDDIEGAGEVDAKNARYVIKEDRYWRGKVYNSSFPFQKTFYASSSSSQVRVALFWLKQNSISGDHTNLGNLNQLPLTDLDLVVKDPNGNIVAASAMFYNNVEVVEFDPTISGTYTIEVIRYTNSTSYEWIGLAWW